MVLRAHWEKLGVTGTSWIAHLPLNPRAVGRQPTSAQKTRMAGITEVGPFVDAFLFRAARFESPRFFPQPRQVRNLRMAPGLGM